MQQRKTLVELAQEVESQKQMKHDFIVSSNLLKMEEDSRLTMGERTYEAGKVAHEQLASKLEIPTKYYNLMLAEKPSLLAENVNTWLQKSTDKRMVRTLGDRGRAVLSDRYRPLDNDIILEAVLPTLFEQGVNLQVTALNPTSLEDNDNPIWTTSPFATSPSSFGEMTCRYIFFSVM